MNSKICAGRRSSCGRRTGSSRGAAVLDHLRRALGTFTELDDERCMAQTLLRARTVHIGQRQWRQAAEALRRVAVLFRRTGTSADEAECWHLPGRTNSRRGTRRAS